MKILSANVNNLSKLLNSKRYELKGVITIENTGWSPEKKISKKTEVNFENLQVLKTAATLYN